MPNSRTQQLGPSAYARPISRLLTAWYRGPDHPEKLRVLRWIEAALGNRRIIARTSAGFDFSVDQEDMSQRQVLYRGVWEPEETALFSARLRPGDVFYDVGANVGYFTCLALQLGVASVVAFEPDDLSAAILRFNREINPSFGGASLAVLQEGVSDTPGRLRFQRAHVANTGVSRFAEQGGVSSFDVAVTTLDEVVFERRLPPPTVMKIDVEGMEWQVLAGAQRLLAECPPRFILFEAEIDPASTGGVLPASAWLDTRLSRMLEQHAYSIEHVTHAGERESRENFLAVRRPSAS